MRIALGLGASAFGLGALAVGLGALALVSALGRAPSTDAPRPLPHTRAAQADAAAPESALRPPAPVPFARPVPAAFARPSPLGDRDGAATAPRGPDPSAPRSAAARRDSARPRRRDTPGAGAPLPASPIELDPLATGSVTARVRGFDPGAPRALLLWRRVGERVAVMARGHSLDDGTLIFPALVVPPAGLEVVVTGSDETPASPGASLPRSVAARAPLPPRAVVRTGAAGEVTLRVVPAEASGRILVAADPGEVFATRDVPDRPDAAGRVFDLALAPGPGQSRVWLAQESPDGRRSDWRAVALVPVPPGEMP